MVPLFRLWKALEDIRKTPFDEVVEVPEDKFVTLVEQVILLLSTQHLENDNERS